MSALPQAALPVPSSPDDRAARAAELAPGGQVACLLDGIDVAGLSESGRLAFLTAAERLASWVSAVSAPALVAHVGAAELVDTSTAEQTDVAALAQSAAREEIQAELAWSERTARSRIEVAREIGGRLRVTGDALRCGRISYTHALTLCDATSTLTDEQAAAVESAGLAKGTGKPPAVMRRVCRIARDQLAPNSALQRHRVAQANRGVTRWAELDGMACLQVRAPAIDIATIWGTLNHLAGRGRDGDTRTLDNRRADALVALCHSGASGANAGVPRVEVQILVGLPTLLGLSERPGVLAGFGPVPAEIAREWARTAESVRRLVTDPVDGHLLDFGPRIRTAPARLRAYVVARDQTCTFPGCRVPAHLGDLDHEPPWKPDGLGGSTSSANLGVLCRHHHRLKTHTDWVLARQSDGTAVWTSPSGRQHPVAPTHPLDPD
jgi:hypothetical protein